MLTTTANLFEGQLLQNVGIYVGTHIGSFKALKILNDEAVDPHKAIKLHCPTDLGKTGKVTSLDWANQEKTELFLGKENQFLKIYNTQENAMTSNVILGGIPVGCARLSESTIAAGLTNGKIQLLDLTKSDAEPEYLSSGDNMTRLRQCSTKASLVATGGKLKDNNVKVWDLESKKVTFSSKNVRPSELQLEMPIWDNDLSFVTETNIATCSRHGYVRYYDTRSQRRPVSGFQSSDRDQYSFSCLATSGTLAYVGLTVGGLQCYDLRQLKRAVHVYKAAIGSVSDVQICGDNGEYLVSASLDRFVRVHSTESNTLLYQNYMQSKVTRLACCKIVQEEQKKAKTGGENDEEEQEQEQDDAEDGDGLDDILGQLPVAGQDEEEEPKKKRSRK